VVITDPADVALRAGSWSEQFAERFLHDSRDIAFVRLSLKLTLIMVPAAVALFVPGVFHWAWAAVYWGFYLFFVGPYILMLHNTSHRPLFKKPYRSMNRYIPWVLGPFFGETPETYFAHHLGMHHPENNLPKDLSSTMRFQRDSFLGFLRYFGRFFLFGAVELPLYHARNGRRKMMWRTIFGELSGYAIGAVLLAINWRAAVVVIWVPLFATRFLMMAGNWAQHAFVDRDDPANPYRNSITCINGVYNKRCFNDGYHIEHHVRANQHWTEMPAAFQSARAKYVEYDGVVFRTVDFFAVWLFLMLKRYDWLAHFYVPQGEPRSKEDLIAFLRSRTQAIPAA
jgi:fatty acid desaturase